MVNNKVYNLQAHCLKDHGGKPDDSNDDPDKGVKGWIWFALTITLISLVVILFCYCKKKKDSEKTFY